MAKTVNRFRVRAGHKTYNEPGPDLLRSRGNAEKTLRGVLGVATDLHKPQVSVGAGFVDVPGKAAVLDAFHNWRPAATGKTDDDDFRVSEMRAGKRVIVAAVRLEVVPIIELAHCSPQTLLEHSLIEYQFPKAIHSGGFLFRQIDGSTAWSDHAWGEATDDSASDGAPNDKTLDWVSRMGKAREMHFDYALGSRDGKVVQVTAPSYDIEPSGAASSHLWHVHISYVDHDGRKPPRNPMFP